MFLKRNISRNKDGSVREYLQIVESRRVNGQPRQVVLLTLGNVEQELGIGAYLRATLEGKRAQGDFRD